MIIVFVMAMIMGKAMVMNDSKFDSDCDVMVTMITMMIL